MIDNDLDHEYNRGNLTIEELHEQRDRLIVEVRRLRDGLDIRAILSEAWVGKKINGERDNLISLLKRADEMLEKYEWDIDDIACTECDHAINHGHEDCEYEQLRSDIAKRLGKEGEEVLMNFPPEYIAICRKLPPHEFEVGDWVIDGKFTEQAKPELIYKDNIDWSFWEEGRFIWLPHRESDWMKMEGWNTDREPEQWGSPWNLSVHHVKSGFRWRVDGASGLHIGWGTDPLLACAKAWEKAVEE